MAILLSLIRTLQQKKKQQSSAFFTVMALLVLGVTYASINTDDGGFVIIPSSFAQELGGGVDVPGTWWLGEGLQEGDYFSYRVCHVSYKECQFFDIEFWINSTIQTGSEEKWLADVVVYDGNKIRTGQMELGKITVETTGSDPAISPYSAALKSSVFWLSAFATSYDGSGGPKAFNAPSWGKIANIGGQQVRPISVESVQTPAGTFEDSIRIGWRTGGADSNVWIIDEFPFPVKASTWVHVSSGIPPQEYSFTLFDYKQNLDVSPFKDVISTVDTEKELGCPNLDNLDFTSIKRSTKNSHYGLEILYKPEEPKQGCDIEWLIKFKNKYNAVEFLNQVQFDIALLDDDSRPIRSLANDIGREFLYSPSGLTERTMNVNESPGVNNYAIIVIGLAPEFVVPDPRETPADYTIVQINIKENDAYATGDPPSDMDAQPAMPDTVQIPNWIKENANLWHSGVIDDQTFLAGIKYMIQKEIIIIPSTSTPPNADNTNSEIPNWIKNNAKLWYDNVIDDQTFASGLQWLIKNGIIKI